MKKNFKRVLSAALVVVMLFTAFPAAFAFGSKETDYTIISPYEQVDWSTWKTYKANLHAHCDASDGDPIPVFTAGYGVNWRHAAGLNSVGIDLVLDSQMAKMRKFNQKRVNYYLNGDSKIQV